MPDAALSKSVPHEPRRVKRRRSPWPSRLGRWTFWAIVLGGVAFNIWWYVRETRPLPSLITISKRVKLKQYDQSDPALKALLQRSPHNDEARLLYAQSLATQKRYLLSARELHRVPFWSPQKREAEFLEGNCYLQLHLARPAAAAWEACVTRDLLHPTPWEHFKAATEQLIELYALEERWDDAHRIIWNMYDEVEAGEHLNVLMMLLRTEIERIDNKVAVGHLEQYAAADPADVFARRALVRTYEALKDNARADRQIAYCLKTWPRDPGVWRDWLGLLDGRGQIEKMAQETRKLPPTVDDDGNIWIYRGRARDLARDWPGAAEAYHKAAELLPYDDIVQYRLYMAEQRLGHKTEALPHQKRSKILKDARARMLDAVLDYKDVLLATQPGDPKRIKATTDVAELCRTIGRTRLADALLKTNEPEDESPAQPGGLSAAP